MKIGLPCQNCGWSPPGTELWPTEGPSAVKWIEENLILGEGDFFGQPFKLRKDQKRFLYRWYEYCGSCYWWRYTEGLRGAASGDGKSSFVAAIVALEFAGPTQYRDKDGSVHGIAPESPNIPIAAAGWEQADLLYGAFAISVGGKDNVVKEAPLCGEFEVYDTRTRFADGRPGDVFRVAAVAGTNEGGWPTLFVCDELHEWGDVGSSKARVRTVIAKSATKRRTLRGPGRVLGLSTAGFDVDKSLLGAIYKQGKRAAQDPTVAPQLLFDWQEAPEGLDLDDPEQRAIAVRAASKAADLQWSVQHRVNQWKQPDMPAHEWMRYYANQWVDVGVESWLKDHPGAWKDCTGQWASSDANEWVLSVDFALKHDSVSVVRVENLPDGRIAVSAKVWTADEFPDHKIHHRVVWDYIVEHARGEGFRGVVYDPRFFELPARMLEDEHSILAVEFPQSTDRMVPAVGETYRRILGQDIVHNGDPVLASHVNSAVSRPQERGGFTLTKGQSKRHIDACIAMCMGVWFLLEVQEEEIIPWVEFV